MKKILSILIISTSIVFIPLVSSAALLLYPNSTCTTPACKAAASETERLNQERIATQEREAKLAAEQAELLRQEQIAAQAEKERIVAQEEADRIQKEKEYQLKIRELEDRINKLETQQATIKTVAPVKNTQVQVTPTISDKKIIQPTVIKKEEPKNEIVVANPSPVVEPVQAPIKKTSWFRRLFSWFK
jgi:hypothetical protein